VTVRVVISLDVPVLWTINSRLPVGLEPPHDSVTLTVIATVLHAVVDPVVEVVVMRAEVDVVVVAPWDELEEEEEVVAGAWVVLVLVVGA